MIPVPQKIVVIPTKPNNFLPFHKFFHLTFNDIRYYSRHGNYPQILHFTLSFTCNENFTSRFQLIHRIIFLHSVASLYGDLYLIVNGCCRHDATPWRRMVEENTMKCQMKYVLWERTEWRGHFGWQTFYYNRIFHDCKWKYF